MKKVLIVSPHFPPINAPDMQRVRLALPHLREQGWEPTVLAVAPESIEGGVREPRLEQTYPADVRIVRVRGVSPALTRWVGIGNLWWRCGRALTAAGEQLLREQRFDLVFFSTTQFSTFTLGPKWKREFGVPYVLDYQDPWVNDYYERTQTKPPGGAIRYALGQRQARRDEPVVLREAAAVIAVSEAYGRGLGERYPWFDAKRVRLLPFGTSEKDFEVAGREAPRAPMIDFADGRIHHVYTGRSGPDMAAALTILFRAFRGFRTAEPETAARMQFHFIGTSYAPPPLGRETVKPIAQAEGVAEHVAEHPYRVPYFEALHYLQRASAVMGIGSDDPAYSASKLYPLVLARRPLLLIFHQASPVLTFAGQISAGQRYGFDGKNNETVAADVQRGWFAGRGYEQPPQFDAAAFAPFTSRVLTARLAEIFEAASVGRA